MTAVCIVQARIGSTRLPGKVMLPLAGEPVIHRVLRRCGMIWDIDQVVCAVPDEARSAPIAAEAASLGIPVVYGSETDVLARYHQAAVEHRADVVLRVTADCPMIDPAVCALVLGPVLAGAADYASNVLPRTWPKGLDCEAFTFAALDRAHREATDAYDREHVTPWLQRACGIRRVNIDGPGKGDVSLTLDTPEDYARLAFLTRAA